MAFDDWHVCGRFCFYILFPEYVSDVQILFREAMPLQIFSLIDGYENLKNPLFHLQLDLEHSFTGLRLEDGGVPRLLLKCDEMILL